MPLLQSRAIALALAATLAAGVGALSTRGGRALGPSQHVVYFVGTPATGSLAPSSVKTQVEQLGFTYHSVAAWQDVLEVDAASGVDALIVDEGSIQSADSAWMRDKYQHRVVIGSINRDLFDLATVLQDPRLSEDATDQASARSAWISPDYFAVAYAGVYGTPVALTAVAIDPEMEHTDLPAGDHVTRYFNATQNAAIIDSSLTDNPAEDVTSYQFYGALRLGLLDALK